MPYTLVQHTNSLTFGSNLTAGNAAFLMISYTTGNTLSAVTGSTNGAYTQAFTFGASTGRKLEIWYKVNVAAGAETLTLTGITGAVVKFWGVAEFSGLGSSFTVDVTVGANNGGPLTFTFSPTGSDLILSLADNSAGATGTLTNLTLLDTLNNAPDYWGSTSGAGSFTGSDAGITTGSIIGVAFKPSSSNIDVASSGTIGVSGVTNVQLAAEPPITGTVGVTGQVAVGLGVSSSGSIGVTGAVQALAQAQQVLSGLVGVTGQVFVTLSPVIFNPSGQIGVTGLVFIVLQGGGPSPPPPTPPIPVPSTGVNRVGLIERFDVVINSILKTNPTAIVSEASTGNLYFLRSIRNRVLVSTQDPRYNPGLRYSQVEYLPDQGTISWVMPNGQRKLLYTIMSTLEWSSGNWLPN